MTDEGASSCPACSAMEASYRRELRAHRRITAAVLGASVAVTVVITVVLVLALR